MGIMFWRPLPIVGNVSMAQEHDRLEAFLLQLREAAREGKSYFAIEDILAEMILYARYHFDDEESLMRDSQYPGVGEHVAEHQKIYCQLQQLAAKCRCGEAVFSSDAVFVARDWLCNHVERYDAPLSEHLEKRSAL